MFWMNLLQPTEAHTGSDLDYTTVLFYIVFNILLDTRKIRTNCSSPYKTFSDSL